VASHLLCIHGQYLRLRALQRQSYTHYFYEATVGAGLPIISTLRGLLETGDRILQIEGIFRFVVKLFFYLHFSFYGLDSLTYQTFGFSVVALSIIVHTVALTNVFTLYSFDLMLST